MSKSDRETYYITAQKIPKVNIFPCWQHRTTRSLKVRQQRVNLALPVREAQVNKKESGTGASLSAAGVEA